MPINHKKKIGVLTTSRADFGILQNVILSLKKHFTLKIIVSGSHFLNYGEQTRKEVLEFCYNNNLSFEFIKPAYNKKIKLCQASFLAKTQIEASKKLRNYKIDGLVYLGDRWELWGITIPAFFLGIPLFHISGGEVTDGCIDDITRHAHSKMSHLHFVSSKKNAKVLYQLGEEHWRVNVCGEPGLDSLHKNKPDLNLKGTFDKKSILIVMHPATMDLKTSLDKQINGLLAALSMKKLSKIKIMFSYPGNEIGSDYFVKKINTFLQKNKNAEAFSHQGRNKFLNILRRSIMMIGNSSSGIVEAPSLGVPSINIGNRQRNRIAAKSVIQTGYGKDSIKKAILKILNKKINKSFFINPYDPFSDGKNSERICMAIKKNLLSLKKVSLKEKRFQLK